MPKVIYIGGGVVPTYRSSALYNGASVSTFTFSGMAIGPASPGRLVVLGLVTSFATTCTLNGNAMTEYRRPGTGGDSFLRFYVLEWATDTTADFVITRAAAVAQLSVAVWSVEGASSAVPADWDVCGGTISPPAVVSVQAGDGLIGFASPAGSPGDHAMVGVSTDFSVDGAFTAYDLGGVAEISATNASYSVDLTPYDAAAFIGAIAFR